MEDKIRLLYIDEESHWQSIVDMRLKNDFCLSIPENLPKDLEDLWEMIVQYAPQAILIDYRLNVTGKVSYTGDDAIRECRKHNKHLPMFIITSFEESALLECKEAEIIRGKDLLTTPELLIKLKNIVVGNVANYNRRKMFAENTIKEIQNKIAAGEHLSSTEKSSRFDAELYLSELDLDNSVRSDLITSTSNQALEELLQATRKIVDLYKK